MKQACQKKNTRFLRQCLASGVLTLTKPNLKTIVFWVFMNTVRSNWDFTSFQKESYKLQMDLDNLIKYGSEESKETASRPSEIFKASTSFIFIVILCIRN